MSDAIEAFLRNQADEIASAGHNGWGNTMLDAASEIEALRARVADKDCAVAMLAAQTRAKLDLLGEVLTLRANLADCQAVIRDRGHDADCRAKVCITCGYTAQYSKHWNAEHDSSHHFFNPEPCSDACGYTRTTGEKL